MSAKAQQMVEHRRCCEALAQRVVVDLLEDDVTEADLVGKALFIDRLRYGDVVEERGEVQRVCGYPLCNTALGAVSKQKYHISLADKKVYDVTQRNRFCCDYCYQASCWYNQQLSEAPVWARKGVELPAVRLYPRRPTASSQAESAGSSVPISAAGVVAFSATSSSLIDVITHKPRGQVAPTLPTLVVKERPIAQQPP